LRIVRDVKYQLEAAKKGEKSPQTLEEEKKAEKSEKFKKIDK